MRSRAGLRAAAAAVVLGSALVVGPGAALGAGDAPTITRGGGVDRFEDDFILDLCGITTETTLTERWTLKEFPDGSSTLHTVRTFVPADARIPIEKAGSTSFNSADGSRVVVGTPILLIRKGEGVVVVDAGRVAFDPSGDISDVRGPHPFLSADLAELYCP
jgi:hypothetical protein